MPSNASDIISIGNTLIEQHPNTFTDDFEENKIRVEQLTSVEAKRVRNRIAGYITRKQKERELQ
ncbi:30S ribosomal protein S17e [Natrinema sp. 1APR25-10V2]|uniref:30S ribosomal protein S17e n=1 Tax=Natrinema sp. 1APR25-10V2 TaxID=2951081 RepID=UPI0028767288|nr:30S ribosomal protein S17e [Natrinema sp. 1APR25-10V2]MDS0477289.1 30S ribosomal protein S17e [Natrinema sp. 1APR25-10V2]